MRPVVLQPNGCQPASLIRLYFDLSHTQRILFGNSFICSICLTSGISGPRVNVAERSELVRSFRLHCMPLSGLLGFVIEHVVLTTAKIDADVTSGRNHSTLRPVQFECVAAMSHRGIKPFVLNPSGSNPSVSSDAYLISVLGRRSRLLCRRRSVRCGAHSDALGPFKRRQVSTTIPRTVAIIAVPLSIHKLWKGI